MRLSIGTALSALRRRNRPEKRWRRAGIRARLFMAFGAVAGMTVVAAVVASLLLAQIGGLLRDMAERNIPQIATTLELASYAEALRAIGPGLISAESQAQRTEQVKSLTGAQAAITERLETLAAGETDQAAVTQLGDETGLLKSKLTALDGGIQERQNMADAAAKSVVDIATAQEDLIKLLQPALEQARAAIAAAATDATLDDAARLQKLTQELLPRERAVADLIVTLNDGTAMLEHAATLPDDAAVAELEKRFADLADHVAQMIQQAPAGALPENFNFAADELLDLGTGGNRIFEIRRQQFSAQRAARKILADATAITNKLGDGVKERIAAADERTKAATERSDGAIAKGRLIMLALAAASVIAAFLFVWLYIGRNLVARLVGLAQVMTRIAKGDLEAEVAAKAKKQDEIGDMAGALAVFRDGILRANALAAEKAREQEASQQRTVVIEGLTQNFSSGAASALSAVSTASQTMQGTAERMSQVAQQAGAETSLVAAAAGQAAINVQTVAEATRELSGSIHEIATQVAESAQIAAQAVGQVAVSRDTVNELSKAAHQIGEVVGLINSIAGQTNLLALNATIEAARAGEAGKGFAVVAGEVKNLATQTAKATDGITAQINAIQGSTERAVGAIKDIGVIIGRMAEISTSVAAAIEEQGATTQGIAHNIQEAAAGTQEVSAHIGDLTAVADSAGKAASEVLSATERLTHESETLRGEVDSFLTQIKAA